MMRNGLRLLGQIAAYAAFAAFIGYFAAAPAWSPSDSSRAEIKLSFSHAGARVQECRRYTPEELAKIPPNMRRPLDCPRARVPLVVELDLDGAPLYRAMLPPSGAWKDGQSSVYRRFVVAPGAHRLAMRLRDSRRATGFDHEKSVAITLVPRQNLVVDFRPDKGGFLVR
jgi:hypothetical protein